MEVFENLHITLINRFLLKSMLYPLQCNGRPKEMGHEEPYYNTKISIFSFTWAGLTMNRNEKSELVYVWGEILLRNMVFAHH